MHVGEINSLDNYNSFCYQKDNFILLTKATSILLSKESFILLTEVGILLLI